VKKTNAGIWKNLLRKAFVRESMEEFVKTGDPDKLRPVVKERSILDKCSDIIYEAGVLNSADERSAIYLKAVQEAPGMSEGTKRKLRRRLGI